LTGLPVDFFNVLIFNELYVFFGRLTGLVDGAFAEAGGNFAGDKAEKIAAVGKFVHCVWG